MSRSRNHFQYNRSGLAVVLSCLAMLTTSACATLAPAPGPNMTSETRLVKITDGFESVDPGHGVHLIHTRDFRTIKTFHFEVTEAGFVVKSEVDVRYHRPQVFKPPLEIKFEDVEWVARWERHWREKTTGEKVLDTTLSALSVLAPQ